MTHSRTVEDRMGFDDIQRALGASLDPETHDPTSLSLVLDFADARGRRCSIGAGDILRAFLALDQEGLVPDPGEDWRKTMARHLETAPDLPAADLAQYSHLERVADGLCETCGAVCQALFRAGTDAFRLERWAVVTSIMVLEDQGYLLPLPIRWYQILETNHESLCETGRHVFSPRQSGVEDV